MFSHQLLRVVSPPYTNCDSDNANLAMTDELISVLWLESIFYHLRQREDMSKYELTADLTENRQYWKMMVKTGPQRSGDGL